MKNLELEQLLTAELENVRGGEKPPVVVCKCDGGGALSVIIMPEPGDPEPFDPINPPIRV